MKTTVIIPAAGTGSRMGCRKCMLLLDGIPVLYRTISAFDNHDEIDEMVIVASKDEFDVISDYKFKKPYKITIGGCDRQSSVRAGIDALCCDVTNVLIHDAARPLVTNKIISDTLAVVMQGHCAVSGVKTKDTVKVTDEKNKVQDTPARDNIWIVQTPQGFPHHIIKEAHKQAYETGFNGTDDAVLVERLGLPVCMVDGDYSNIKLTTPDDMIIAEALIKNGRR